ncbi:MAG: hypothetical protein VYB54_00245 [Pseudomonadota bacterium]|nr:hypothetical protein [Pseudomonadota bacterium]
MTDATFLPGVAVDHVLARLAKAGGNEAGSGKLASPESSAALAVNCFGWFIGRPERLPPLPGLEDAGVPEIVDVEFSARFPWRGGRHPWLDAVVRTPTTLIGVESKRFEPFRDAKSVALSVAYDRTVWGQHMRRFEAMRDSLRAEPGTFRHLDAAQLLKHAFGLVTEGRLQDRAPVLCYLYAEPAMRGDQPILPEDIRRHRDEISRFAAAVAGDEVRFIATSYRDWLRTWAGQGADVAAHADGIIGAFEP